MIFGRDSQTKIFFWETNLRLISLRIPGIGLSDIGKVVATKDAKNCTRNCKRKCTIFHRRSFTTVGGGRKKLFRTRWEFHGDDMPRIFFIVGIRPNRRTLDHGFHPGINFFHWFEIGAIYSPRIWSRPTLAGTVLDSRWSTWYVNFYIL